MYCWARSVDCSGFISLGTFLARSQLVASLAVSFATPPYSSVCAHLTTPSAAECLVMSRPDILVCILTYLLHGAELLEKLTGSAASQEIPRTLWNPKVHHRIQKCPPSVRTLSQLHPVSTPSQFSKIHLNIILPSTSGSPHILVCIMFQIRVSLLYDPQHSI